LRNLATWDAAEVEGALDAVGVPVLAIQSTTMDTARERISLAAGLSSPWIDLVRAHVPRAAIEMLAGTSHFPQIERADDVNASITRFALNEQLFPREGLTLT
jgi:pimeloyl-ACP methyl ester carboxylesterase